MGKRLTDISDIIRAAEAGDTEGQYLLAERHAFGRDVPEDYPKALELYQAAATGGNTAAMAALGISYLSGFVGRSTKPVTAPDLSKAAAWLKKVLAAKTAALDDEARALWGLGIAEERMGHAEKATEYFRRSGEEYGRGIALEEYGKRLFDGRGIAADKDRGRQIILQAIGMDPYISESQRERLSKNYGIDVAMPSEEERKRIRERRDACVFDHLLRRAEKGDVRAQLEVGAAYRRGRKGEGDSHQKALYWLEKAAAQGSLDALRQLGAAHLYDDLEHRDPAKSFYWYRLAAEAGDGEAQGRVGIEYMIGKDVRQDMAVGVGWLKKAAAQGDASSLETLGFAYFYGGGTPRDLSKAVECWERGADLDDIACRVCFGRVMMEGVGVPQDQERGRLAVESALASERSATAMRVLGRIDEALKRKYQ